MIFCFPSLIISSKKLLHHKKNHLVFSKLATPQLPLLWNFLYCKGYLKLRMVKLMHMRRHNILTKFMTFFSFSFFNYKLYFGRNAYYSLLANICRVVFFSLFLLIVFKMLLILHYLKLFFLFSLGWVFFYVPSYTSSWVIGAVLAIFSLNLMPSS